MRITADIFDEESSDFEEDDKKDKQSKTYINGEEETPPCCPFLFQDMLHKFQYLTVSDSYSSSKFPVINSSLLYNKNMDAAESSGVKQDQAANADLPDEHDWILPYLAKMKADLKKEVLDEVILSLTCNKALFQGFKRYRDQPTGDVVHTNIFCDHCEQQIHGIRYKCGNCSEFDLCQDCEEIPDIHDKRHIFLKIRYPVAMRVKQKRRRKEAKNEDGSSKDVNAVQKNFEPAANVPKCNLKTVSWSFGAKYVCDETFPDYSIIAPSTKFVKSWRVANSGSRPWTEETKLHYLRGPKDLIPESASVDVPPLEPGEEGVVSVAFTSPPLAGLYQSHWQFRHKNISFGHWLWCDIIVSFPNNQGSKEVTQLMQQACESSNPWVEIITPFLSAKEEENPRKLLVSHTATPNNTPFDLTPPKSPDHQEAAAKNGESLPKVLGGEDDYSVLGLSSSDSETEFVVIPMPKCFNMPDSFLCRQLPPDPPVAVSQETGVPEGTDYHSVSVLQVADQVQVSVVDGKDSISIAVSDEEHPLAEEKNEEPQEGSHSIPGSATFPKFPVNAISSPEERVIQVLPEKLVTGALSAAAIMYNRAKEYALSTMQPRCERVECISQELPQPHTAEDAGLSPMMQLIEMGFGNRQLNEQLLEKHKGNVTAVVAELVNMNDNDWYQSRHVVD